MVSRYGSSFEKVIQVFAIVLVPVTIGMVVRSRAPAKADWLTRPVKVLSVVFLVLVVVATIATAAETA